jgi:hypothetical protein
LLCLFIGSSDFEYILQRISYLGRANTSLPHRITIDLPRTKPEHLSIEQERKNTFGVTYTQFQTNLLFPFPFPEFRAPTQIPLRPFRFTPIQKRKGPKHCLLTQMIKPKIIQSAQTIADRIQQTHHNSLSYIARKKKETIALVHPR